MEKLWVGVRMFLEHERPEELVAPFMEPFAESASDAKIEAYYKFEGWHVISFVVEIDPVRPNEGLQTTGDRLASGWSYTLGDDDEDYSGFGIWNPSPANTCIVPACRFGDISLLTPDHYPR